MLRLLVVLLVLANASFYVWSQGWLAPLLGTSAHADREPERLARQVNPERLQILSAGAASSTEASSANTATASAPAPVTRACLEIGPYTTPQVAAAESALQTAVPLGRYSNVKNETPAVWIVYMGRYSDRETLQKKTDELKKLKIPFEALRDVPELGDGLALGRYADAAAAEQGLQEVAARGVRTARVAQLSAANASHMLRVDQAEPALQTKLLALQGSGLQGKTFSACPR